MPKVRYLCVRFSQNLFAYDIPKFRAAVIEKTERVASLFHNHLDDQKVIYRYPLIQYKINHKKASIVCLDAGVDDIHYLLQHRDMNLRIGAESYSFEVDNIDLHYHQVQIWNSLFDYSLMNWLALSQKNHLAFKELEGDDQGQVDLLHRILCGNLLSFAKGINWQVEERIKLEITQIKEIKMINFKGQDCLAFTLNFRCNVSLPDYVGLGKGSSVGFGVVKLLNDEKK